MLRRLPLCCALALLPAPPARGTDAPTAESRPRVLRHFDFEEAERALVEFPLPFKRNIAEDRGFFRFGSMRLSDAAAAGGRWSFRFDLDGGSLSASVPTGVIPILPLADYEVSCAIRTQGLTHARARLVAWLTDVDGAPVPGTRCESEALATGGAWQRVAVAVRGRSERAVDLVLELQLVQPDQLPDAGASDGRQDVRGTAWFDDVIVRHLPRIELDTGHAANVLVLPEAPRLTLLVHDLTSGDLVARLAVEDIEGKVVFERRLPAPRGRQPQTIALPIETGGWYSARVDLEEDGARVGNARLDFAVVPPLAAPGRTGTALGVLLPAGASASQMPRIETLTAGLAPDAATVPLWESRAHGDDDAALRSARRRQLLEGLLARRLDLTLALEEIPPGVAAAADLEVPAVLALIAGEEAAWRSHLEPMLIDFALRVLRWQLGPTDRPLRLGTGTRAELAGRARAQLGRFVPDVQVSLPVAAEEPLPPAVDFAPHVVMPYHVRPESLLNEGRAWGAGRDDVEITFELLPRDAFGARQQVADLARRALYGWRAGLSRMSIEAPWRFVDAGSAPGGTARPEPVYPAWRGLADGLRGRRFAGVLELGEGVQAWLMEATDPARHALVVWRDEAAPAAPAEIRLHLGAGPVTLIDLFGNGRRLAPRDGRHAIPISDRPVFVTDIDYALARFRSMLAITPSFVDAAHQVHERELTIHNPWPIGMTGRVAIEHPADCRITPRLQTFNVPAGETARIPVEAHCARGVAAGVKRLVASVRLETDRLYDVQVPLRIEVGWEQVAVNATWRVMTDTATGARDLLIVERVTNLGPNVLHLDAFVRGDGLPQTRRNIAGLKPGTTTIKTFRIPNGSARLAGREVLVGVVERGSTAQFTRRLEIPSLLAPAGVAEAE